MLFLSSWTCFPQGYFIYSQLLLHKEGTLAALGFDSSHGLFLFFLIASELEGGLVSLASPESLAIPELMINVTYQMKCSE